MLTAKQKYIARTLRETRPPVIEGTNTIPDAQERQAWYERVNRAMDQYRVTDPGDVWAFCDLAGVPD